MVKRAASRAFALLERSRAASTRPAVERPAGGSVDHRDVLQVRLHHLQLHISAILVCTY